MGKTKIRGAFHKHRWGKPLWNKNKYRFHWAGSETDTWLDFARGCGYLNEEDYKRLTEKCRSVGRMLGSMLNTPSPFVQKV